MTKEASEKQTQKAGKSPSGGVAPRGTMPTGRSPEPENKHTNRTATKRLLTKEPVDELRRAGQMVIGTDIA